MSFRMSMFLFCYIGLSTAMASQLIYEPVNPSFGGDALNSDHLIFHAEAINDYKGPDDDYFGYEEESAIEQLASSLESRLISELLADIGNGNTGQLETDDYFLNIVEGSNNALMIQIVDKKTGESSSIQVSGLNPN